ncbi:MAG: NrtA/SsuA/CpmA family ABC transporter substrate-binding protein [Chromatiaceae bacterium]|nr:NrtA/SsuA/CpmA family ABC transporter substrate-binding protein [Chromatiaceae bacterium]
MKKTTMNRVAALLTLALALTACQQSPAPATEPPQTLRIAFTDRLESALVHIALIQGYFRAEGLDIQPVMRTFGKAALEAILDGQADLATVAETPIMFAVLQGANLRVLATLLESDTNLAVVARGDAGIASAKDLKGKRIGYTPGTASDFFLAALLTANGLPRQEVLAVDLKPDAMQEALLAGEVDAVATWSYYPLVHALGPNARVILDSEIYTQTFNLVARQDFIDQHPLVIQKVLRALIKAEGFARTQPDAAQTLLAEATQIDPSLVQEILGNFQFLVGLDQILLLILEDETRWAISNQLTDQTQMPDYSTILYLDGLKAVQPDAIFLER